MIPNGIVQSRLTNFVTKFPNLGMRVGGCNESEGEKNIITASCQILNTESRKGGRITETKDLDCQARNAIKHDRLPGTSGSN